MSAHSPQDAAPPARGCGGNCGMCGGRGIPDAPPGSPCGARLAVCAVLVFVLPLAAAAYGAVRAGANGVSQALGALMGFAIGVIIAQGALRLLRWRWGAAS